MCNLYASVKLHVYIARKNVCCVRMQMRKEWIIKISANGVAKTFRSSTSISNFKSFHSKKQRAHSKKVHWRRSTISNRFLMKLGKLKILIHLTFDWNSKRFAECKRERASLIKFWIIAPKMDFHRNVRFIILSYWFMVCGWTIICIRVLFDTVIEWQFVNP
jgi:hypothetical protein